jgi:hypothetical protein
VLLDSGGEPADLPMVLALPSQHPVYRRMYAKFKRAVATAPCADEVSALFGKNSKELFKQWLEDGKSFQGAVLRLQQTRASAKELKVDYAFRPGFSFLNTRARLSIWRWLCVLGHPRYGVRLPVCV